MDAMIEKYCSQFADADAVTRVLGSSNPDFKRGVLDMCAAFNYKIDAAPNAAPGRNDVVLMTEGGWVAGRLLYCTEYKGSEPEWYFKFVSRKIKKQRGDARSDRNSRAATKMRDLIKVLRAKQEVITDANAFEHEERAVRYAYDSVRSVVEDRALPKITLQPELADDVMRAALGDMPLPEVLRIRVQEAYDKYLQECTNREESQTSLKMFSRGCYAVGLFNYWDKTNYFVGKVAFTRASTNSTKIELQGPMKRYTTLVGTELETDAAIIRTYMQSRSGHDANNEFNVPRMDKYYPEVEVATGYSGDAMLWVLLPERT